MTRREILFEAGVQYGHGKQNWCPKMKPFIWGEKDGIYLINVALTEIQITKAEKLLEEIAAKGLPILWVGTKKVARAIVEKRATECNSPYFSNRWIGGSLTNYHEVKKSVTNMLYNKEILEKADRSMYTKKELNLLNKKIERAGKTVSGIEGLSWPVGALVVTDVKKDRVAVLEAKKMGIPVIGIVDTNCDPEGITVVIPANDDLERSLDLVLGYLSEAIKKGMENFKKENPVADVEKKLNNSEKKTFNKDNNKFGNRNSDKRNFNDRRKENSFNKKSEEVVSESEKAEKVEVVAKTEEKVVANKKPSFGNRNAGFKKTADSKGEKPAGDVKAKPAVKKPFTPKPKKAE